jgi:hypothetical protein
MKKESLRGYWSSLAVWCKDLKDIAAGIGVIFAIGAGIIWVFEKMIGWQTAFYLLLAWHILACLVFWHKTRSGIRVESSMSVPQPIVPSNPPPPYFGFREGDYENLHWTWGWHGGSVEPVPGMIDELACFCLSCRLRVKPAVTVRDDVVEFDKGRYGMYGDRQVGRIGVISHGSEFFCEVCHKGPTFQESIEAITDRVKRLIERDARKLMSSDTNKQ